MRAQIQSQVIVYILAVVIMAMVLIFGYRIIDQMRKQADTAQLIQFRQDLANAIKTTGGDYGTQKVKTIAVPSKFRQICFANLDHLNGMGDNDVAELIVDMPVDRIVRDRITDMVNPAIKLERKNVFFCPPCTEQDFVGTLALLDKNGDDTVYRCYNVTMGTIRLTITGLGDRAQLS